MQKESIKNKLFMFVALIKHPMARKKQSIFDGFLYKTSFFALLCSVAFWLFDQYSDKKNTSPVSQQEIPRSGNTSTPNPPGESQVPEEILPSIHLGELVTHTYFALSYSEDHEQAEWVAYEITLERLNKNWAERPKTFRPDPAVRTESATPRDYTGSGYDKGHLCAAADMAFDGQAIEETFFMSNISPQQRTFNGGIWRELEENTRDWARKYGRLYVVTGPVLTQKPLESIGFSKVSVPASYYKVLYAPDKNICIAYVLPNKLSKKPLDDFACSIDDVEAATGIDFFCKMETEIPESSFDTNDWPVNRKRYEKRLRDWNQDSSN